MIGQLASDSSMQGGRTAVFFDECDQGQCGYRGSAWYLLCIAFAVLSISLFKYMALGCERSWMHTPTLHTNSLTHSHTGSLTHVHSLARSCARIHTGNCDFGAFDLESQQAAYIAMFPRMVSALNDAQIVPILSLDNRVTESNDLLPGLKLPCVIPENDVIVALNNLSWVRFYENWPGTFWAPGGADTDAAMIANAIYEANASIPTVLHTGGPKCPPPQRDITRPGERDI